MSTDCVERAGPEVSWVGPEVEGWEAWQSCLDRIKWQQGARRSRRGREAKAKLGEDDSAVLAGRSGAGGPGDGRGQAGASGGVHPRAGWSSWTQGRGWQGKERWTLQALVEDAFEGERTGRNIFRYRKL